MHRTIRARGKMVILNEPNEQINRIMVYLVSDPTAEQSKQQTEHDQWMQQVPSEPEDIALIFQLVASYRDFSQQLKIFSIELLHGSARLVMKMKHCSAFCSLFF
jgi:hypothetical protein